MATFDARDWLAGLMGCARDELEVRSTDRYGERETQVRYDRGGSSVARVIVTGPNYDMGERDGRRPLARLRPGRLGREGRPQRLRSRVRRDRLLGYDAAVSEPPRGRPRAPARTRPDPARSDGEAIL